MTFRSPGAARFYRVGKVAPQVTLALKDLPANGTPLGAGQAADVAVYDFKLGTPTVELQSIHIDFNQRLWLYAKALYVTYGPVILAGTKEGEELKESDFAQIEGAYRFSDGQNEGYVLPQSEQPIKIMVVMRDEINRPSADISITKFQMVTSDQGSRENSIETSHRSFSYVEKIGQGEVVVELSENSWISMSQQIARTSETEIWLGNFEVKSQAISGYLSQIVFILDIDGASANALFKDVVIVINHERYSATAIGETADGQYYARFSNLSNALPADQWINIQVQGTVNPDTDGKLSGASVTVGLTTSTSSALMNNPEVVSADGTHPIDVVPATIVAGTMTFFSAPVVISNKSVQLKEMWFGPGGQVLGQVIDYSFTVTNVDDSEAVYMKGDCCGFATLIDSVITTTDVSASGSTTGDKVEYFIIPPGTSRAFTVHTFLRNYGPVRQLHAMLGMISFDDDAAGAPKYQVWYGLEGLTATTTF